jgi:hypothetical protein
MVDVTGSSLAVSHQAGALEDSQVLGDRGAADGKPIGQLPDRAGTPPDELVDPAARGIGESLERVFVSAH